MLKNPVFCVFAIGIKVLVGTSIYFEIKDKMRKQGEDLAKCQIY